MPPDQLVHVVVTASRSSRRDRAEICADHDDDDDLTTLMLLITGLSLRKACSGRPLSSLVVKGKPLKPEPQDLELWEFRTFARLCVWFGARGLWKFKAVWRSLRMERAVECRVSGLFQASASS